MSGTLIGYARCSTDKQDLTAQHDRLAELGVTEKRIYLDHGLTGTNRQRPGLDQALAAVRGGDTLVVPKLDRLARSVPDARDIGDSLAERGIKLTIGGQVYDPTDPMGKTFFNILATFAEFEVDLLRTRTREGMAVARAKGRLRGKQPKLSTKQQAELRRMHATGDYSIADLAELFTMRLVSCSLTLRTIRRSSCENNSEGRSLNVHCSGCNEIAMRCRCEDECEHPSRTPAGFRAGRHFRALPTCRLDRRCSADRSSEPFSRGAP